MPGKQEAHQGRNHELSAVLPGMLSLCSLLCVLYRTNGEGVRNEVLQEKFIQTHPQQRANSYRSWRGFYSVPVISTAFLSNKHLDNLVLIRHPSYTSGTPSCKSAGTKEQILYSGNFQETNVFKLVKAARAPVQHSTARALLRHFSTSSAFCQKINIGNGFWFY